MAKIYKYTVSPEGIVYRWSKHSGLKEVPKRMASNGRGLVLRVGGNPISYSNFVAKALIPNPDNCNLVIHIDGDYFNTHPSNLRWVWTRYKRTLSKNEAIAKATDKNIIEFYKTGNDQIIKNAIEKIYNKFKPELVGELYLRLMNYASRNLLFNLETDAIITYIGLIRQEKLNSCRNVEYKDYSCYDSFL